MPLVGIHTCLCAFVASLQPFSSCRQPYKGTRSISTMRVSLGGHRERQKDLDIASVGNMCLDIVLPISQYPVQRGEHQLLTMGARMELGGSMNALISAKRLGASVAPVAYIAGEDAYPSDALISNYIRDSAARLGLDITALVARRGTVIPTCAALFDSKGAHTFLASNELPQADVGEDIADAPACMLETVTRAKVLVVDGFALHSDRRLVWQTVRTALNCGTKLWVDPQSAASSLLRTNDHLFKFIMDNAQGISLTTDEALLIAQRHDPLDAITALGDEYCPVATTFLLKEGPDGSHIASREAASNSYDYCTVSAFPIANDLYKDSIGAGDAFLGGFLAGILTHGLSMRDSGLLANAMGASTCMRHGAGDSGVGTRASAVELLKNTSLAPRHLAL